MWSPISRYGRVDPNSATVGTEKAQPMCVRPVSTPITKLARLTKRRTLQQSAPAHHELNIVHAKYAFGRGLI